MSLSMQVELFFKCEHLENKDTLSKSDPFLTLYAIGCDGNKQVIGKTEVVKDCLNPHFKQTITVEYHFETEQRMRAEIADYDSGGGAPDQLGAADFVLARVMGSRGCTATIPLSSGKGSVSVTGAECGSSNDLIELTIIGTHMKNMDTFGKSDPYYKLYRVLPNGDSKLLHTSEVIDGTLEPRWKSMPAIEVSKLCGAKVDDRVIRLECFDRDTIGSDDQMGMVRMSYTELIDACANKRAFDLEDSDRKRYGQIVIERANVIKVPTFIDYLKGGLQINLTVSVDFTGSNGNPNQPESLHFINPTAPNQYEMAIMSVGEVLSHYDIDKQFPCFGFGAKLPDGQVSHYFHLNLQPNPYVPGIDGILAAYRNCIQTVTFYGPTNFSPTINSIAKAATDAVGVYTVLLILTDGEITDMADTVRAIVHADSAPLSIVIVGVGEADFTSMETLDGDGGKLSAGGRVARRDIVQFVPMNKFKSRRAGPELAAEVLREIPRQLVNWARMNKIQPGHGLTR